MKPNELFFGALVSLKGTPCRVVHIDGTTIGVVDGENRYRQVSLSDLLPISLTFEFMTKNFPKPDKVVWNPGAVDNNHCFYCEVGGEDSQKSVSGDFYYVHELQAALRLCGIEKNSALHGRAYRTWYRLHQGHSDENKPLDYADDR